MKFFLFIGNFDACVKIPRGLNILSQQNIKIYDTILLKGDCVKLSEITKEILTNDDIQKIVYENIDDNGKSSIYGLVFGNSMLINERVSTAVDAYRNDRIKKIIFSGGSNGISNQDNDIIPEAIKMKKLAIELGVNEGDILIDDTSNNSF